MAFRKITEKVVEIKPNGDVITFFEGYSDSSDFDKRPKDKVAEGSNFIETDTGDWYFFNEKLGDYIKELTIQE